LALLWERDAQGVQRRVSAANFLDWRAQSKSFSDLAAWAPAGYVMTGTDHAQQIGGATVTSNLFRTLGVQPVLGRTFGADEEGLENPGNAARVAVISYRLWQDSFGGGKDVLGRTIELNANPYTIIGVMPSDFEFLARRQVWVPLSVNRVDRDYRYLFAVARLRGSRQSASAEMGTLARALAQEYPRSNTGWTVEVQDLLDWLVNRTFRTRLLLLFGAVAMVLFITCTNVAGLLLTRSIARTREMAVRVALGASQGRLIRQLLTESLLLSFLGGAAGLAVAWMLLRIAPSLIPPNAIPATVPIQLNAAMVFFTLALTAVTGIIFGLVPAVAGMRLDVQGSLKDGSRGATTGHRRQQFRQAMVAIQVAVALMLVVSAALMSQSLNKLTQIDPGFEMKNVLTVRVFLSADKYTAASALAFRRQALERIRTLPGVESATAASNLPLFNVTMEVPFDLEDSPPRPQAEQPGVGYAAVSPGYFETLRIPLRFGRTFADTDHETAPPVVIVNEAFVERYFPAQNPVGKRILLHRPILGKNGFEEAVRSEIVGVAGDVRFGLETPDRNPMVYAPDSQNLFSSSTWFAVRSRALPASVASAVRNQLMQMDNNQPVDQIGSLEQTFSNQFSESKFQTTIMSAFAVLALLLAVIGIYGVNSYAVAQRRHEIGIRMALGAAPGTILRATIWSGMRLTLIGILAGLLGALATASLLRSVLVGVSATAPYTLSAAALALAVISWIACYLPARRAMLIEPASALRQE
jgi:predicted permease